VKSPVVAITAAFVCGIAVGLRPSKAARAGSRELVMGFFIATGVQLILGVILASRGYL